MDVTAMVDRCHCQVWGAWLLMAACTACPSSFSDPRLSQPERSSVNARSTASNHNLNFQQINSTSVAVLAGQSRLWACRMLGPMLKPKNWPISYGVASTHWDADASDAYALTCCWINATSTTSRSATSESMRGGCGAVLQRIGLFLKAAPTRAALMTSALCQRRPPRQQWCCHNQHLRGETQRNNSSRSGRASMIFKRCWGWRAMTICRRAAAVARAGERQFQQ